VIKLEIHPHFRNLIKPLSDDEFKQLEENILANGCRDTIKHWRGFIVDGHNRYEICQKHSLPYRIQKLGFGTDKDATLWIINNQLGRRNITEATKVKLALAKMDLLREKAKENRTKVGCKPVHVHKEAAKDAGISVTKLYKYMKIYEIGEPRLLQQLESGEIKVAKAYNDLRACRNSEYKLVVAEKTVDVWYESEPTGDITAPAYERSFASNIEKLTLGYKYLMGKAEHISQGEERLLVKRRLLKQREAVMEMLEGVG